jgi:AcrR family transcriptional regulator
MSSEAMKSRREEYSEATQEALLAAGRDLFVEKGYQSVGVEAIARAARVTRGAFYHHFDDKAALFDRLIVKLQADAAARVVAKTRRATDRWERLRIGVDAFLEICCEPTYRRLVIEEAPSVLGSARCREIEDQSAVGLMVGAMVEMQRGGELDVGEPSLAARMVASMICEAALLLEDGKGRLALRRAAGKIVDRVLASFRPNAT